MPATPGRPQDERAAALLRRVGHALLRVERERVCCGEVTSHQFTTLRLLDQAGGLSTSEVASGLGIDLSTASRNLAVLERAGCIRRRRSAADARAVVNLVTSKGRSCMETLCSDERSALAAAWKRVPPEQRQGLEQALTSLIEALESETPSCCAVAGSCTPDSRSNAVAAQCAPTPPARAARGARRRSRIRSMKETRP